MPVIRIIKAVRLNRTAFCFLLFYADSAYLINIVAA